MFNYPILVDEDDDTGSQLSKEYQSNTDAVLKEQYETEYHNLILL